MQKNSVSNLKAQLATNNFWLEHIQLRNKSGLDKSAYCRKYELSYGQYIYRERKLAYSNNSVHFIPVQIESSEINNSAPVVTSKTSEDLSEIPRLLCSLSFKTGAELKIYNPVALSTLVAVLR